MISILTTTLYHNFTPLSTSLVFICLKQFDNPEQEKSELSPAITKEKIERPIIAVLGTSAIKFIPEEMKRLKAQGVHTIYDALDLDKLTNVNVSRGANKINELIHNEGIQTKNLYWAMDKIKKLFSFLPDNSIAGIENYVKNCTEDSYLPMIPEEIKGIDDFLKYIYDIS